MDKIATVTINFADGRKEYLNAKLGTGIIFLAIEAASHNRPVFFIDSCFSGYQIRVLRPGSKHHEYVSGFRNGEYKWCGDYTYAKNFSLKTAMKHLYNLYNLKY